MACPFDGDDEHPLMLRTGSRDPLGDDASLLRNEPLELFLVLVIHVEFFVVTETAGSFFPLLAVLLPLIGALPMKCHGCVLSLSHDGEK